MEPNSLLSQALRLNKDVWSKFLKFSGEHQFSSGKLALDQVWLPHFQMVTDKLETPSEVIQEDEAPRQGGKEGGDREVLEGFFLAGNKCRHQSWPTGTEKTLREGQELGMSPGSQYSPFPTPSLETHSAKLTFATKGGLCMTKQPLLEAPSTMVASCC